MNIHLPRLTVFSALYFISNYTSFRILCLRIDKRTISNFSMYISKEVLKLLQEYIIIFFPGSRDE